MAASGRDAIDNDRDVRAWLNYFLPLGRKDLRAWEEHVDAFVRTHEDLRDQIAHRLLPKLHMMALIHEQTSNTQAITIYTDMRELAERGATREQLLQLEARRQDALRLSVQYRVLTETTNPADALRPSALVARKCGVTPESTAVALPDDVERLCVHSDRRTALATLLGLSGDRRDQVPEATVSGTVLQWPDRDQSELADVFDRLTHLHIIFLERNNLSVLPASIGSLCELKQLYLTGNLLTTLPDEMRRLVGLRVLSMGANALEALPDWIGDLSDLRELIVYRNKLRRAPRSLARLTQLRVLSLFSNPLEREERDWVQHQLVPMLTCLESTMVVV